MPTDTLPPLAAALDAERVDRGLSVRQMAIAAGLTLSSVQGILSGATPNPGVLTVRAILDALGRDLAWLGRQIK